MRITSTLGGSELTKSRSEYRRELAGEVPAPVIASGIAIHAVDEVEPAALAALLLDAYRGTIDDDGEDDSDARQAIDGYLRKIDRSCSVVLSEGEQPVAMSFVVVVGDVHYIDPVATGSAHKGRGHGSAAVRESLRLLRVSGVTEVGAVVTDGNVASERLFDKLGFVRIGAWRGPRSAGSPSSS